MTEEQCKQFEAVCQPLMRWLRDNMHPHTKVIIDSEIAELVEGLATGKIRTEASNRIYRLRYGNFLSPLFTKEEMEMHKTKVEKYHDNVRVLIDIEARGVDHE